MSNTNKDTKRIAKNTLLLYFRMFIMMFISFYTSRVVLNVLGVEDFGLYNIIGGIVVLFSILNGALSSSTQRFLNYEIGKDNKAGVTSVFKNSLSLHLILICVILILSESIGLWYVNNLLDMPIGRLRAANYIYQFTIATFVLNVLRVPFNASIIAYEKMNFYAYISIAEAILKLLIVYLLLMSVYDKLIIYGFLMMMVTFIINMAYIIYCSYSFNDIKIGLSWNKEKIKSITSFSGWNLFGSVAVVSSQHGINLILNYFCGVALNAAAGIANQVTSAMYGFISNFQVAFNPQIVKLYAQNKKEDFFKLIFRASKFSFILFWLIGLPVLFTTPIIFDIWLNQIPEHSVSFTRIIIIYLLIDALNGPLWTSVNATGKIKKYQILMSFILILNLPVGYIMLYLGYPPEFIWISRVFFNIVAMIARLIYLKKILIFPLQQYTKTVLFPLSIVVIGSLFVSILINDNSNSISNFILITCCSSITITILSFYLVLTKHEREQVVSLIKSKF